eukprot:Rmarinus@m.9726
MGSSSDSNFSRRERQVAEIEVIRSMFPEDGVFGLEDDNAYDVVCSAVEKNELQKFSPDTLPQVRLNFRFDDYQDIPGIGAVCVNIELPKGYPAFPAEISVSLADGARKDQEKCEADAKAVATKLASEESEALLDIIQTIKDILDEWRADAEETAAMIDLVQEGWKKQLGRTMESETFGRRMIYFHHIWSTVKRKYIIEWAIELGLGGYSKTGYPGVIVVEGPEECCAEYVRRLQRLRWKLMVVRGEQQHKCGPGETIDSLRVLHRGFEELDDGGMSTLAQRCREAGLEDLFLTSMKIYHREDKQEKDKDKKKRKT